MARLPQPGADAGSWGEILNDFLRQSLNSDGTIGNDTVGVQQLKPQSVTSASLADGQVTAPKLAAGTAANGQVLSYNGGALDWITPASGPGAVASSDITDSTSIGRTILTAVDATVVRSAIGAGTSNLTLGTTSSTAKAGDYQPTADQITETVTNKVLTSSERTKLAAISSGATANDTDAQLRDRSTHTGTQPLSTISDITASSTELNYSSGVTGAIQAQLNAKGDVVGSVASVLNSLPVFSNTSGKLLKASATTVLTDTGILSTTTTTNVQFKGTGTTGGTSGGAGLGLYSDNGAVQTNNNRLGFVLFGGASDAVGTVVNSGGLFSYADGTWTSTSTPTRLEFEVSPSGATARATALTVKPSGNIGIGTNTPGAKLEVNGEARVVTAGTAATSVVTVGGTQTLSGKTISGSSNTLSNIAQSSVTNLTTDIAAKSNAATILASGMGVVVHGAVASTARPTEFAVITWIGSVTPTNAAANDIWVFKA